MLSKDIEVVRVRDLSYEDAEKEIIEYLQKAGKRKVYVSEIVEKLRLDIEISSDILHKLRGQIRKNPCKECRFYGSRKNYETRNDRVRIH